MPRVTINRVEFARAYFSDFRKRAYWYVCATLLIGLTLKISFHWKSDAALFYPLLILMPLIFNSFVAAYRITRRGPASD